jgi:Fe-S-cluster-containing hydrogenase component 2
MHEGVSNPAKSRIQIVKWEQEGRYVPMICQQCEDAPCKNVCPVGAISRDKDYGFIKVNDEVCIGCRSCVGICPFGAMGFNPATRSVFKCDLCGGDPQCVRFCEVKAVDFIASDIVSARKKRKSAARLAAAERQQVSALQHC